MNSPNRPSVSMHRVGQTRGLSRAALLLLCAASLDATAAELRVQVVEHGAGPLAGAAVCLGTSANPTQFGAARSTRGGMVSFQELPSAPLILTVSKEGYLGRRMTLTSMYSRHTLAVQIPTGGGGPTCPALSPAEEETPPRRLTITDFRVEPAGRNGGGQVVRLVHELSGKATHYRVSESPEISGQDWQPYEPMPHIQVSDGGQKTIYLQVRRYSQHSGSWLETRSSVASATLPPSKR